MARRRWVKFAATAVSLLLVGTIRSVVPEYYSDESPRGPGRDGVADAKAFTAELLDAVATRSINMPLSDGIVETEEALIVVRVRVRSTGEMVHPEYQVVTRDGMRYGTMQDRIATAGYSGSVHAGTQTTVSMAIEVPESKLAGARLVISTGSTWRVEPMRPVAQFDLDDLGQPMAEFTPEPDVVELIGDE